VFKGGLIMVISHKQMDEFVKANEIITKLYNEGKLKLDGNSNISIKSVEPVAYKDPISLDYYVGEYSYSDR
jgi:hypothetical protein